MVINQSCSRHLNLNPEVIIGLIDNHPPISITAPGGLQASGELFVNLTNSVAEIATSPHCITSQSQEDQMETYLVHLMFDEACLEIEDSQAFCGANHNHGCIMTRVAHYLLHSIAQLKPGSVICNLVIQAAYTMGGELNKCKLGMKWWSCFLTASKAIFCCLCVTCNHSIVNFPFLSATWRKCLP